MNARSRVAPRSHEDLEPSYEWKREEGSDTLVISLPGMSPPLINNMCLNIKWLRDSVYFNIGFKKEQVKVQLDSTGNLRVSGARPLILADHKWSRFRKDFRIPENTRTSDIRAKFENENLSVILPKLIRSRTKDQPTKVQETDSDKKATTVTKPREDQDRMSRKDSPLSSNKSDEPTNAVKKEQKIEEDKKDQIHKSDDKKDASHEISDRDAELANSRKRKAVAEDETTANGRMGFRNPRQLMVNVGVAAVILVGLAFYVSCKLRMSIVADNN